MDVRNYVKSGIFNNAQTIEQYINQGLGKEQWIIKQLQGKGYEWDWMTNQRNNVKNIFNVYNAGDVSNKVASDVTKTNILSGKSTEYQMKAYISKTNPNLSNTPKDMTIVTNAEKVAVIKTNKYENVQEFQNINEIQKATNQRLKQIKEGSVQTSYNKKNVTGTMAKAGLIGCVIGIGTEALTSYKTWKQGQLSDEEYIKEILLSGGDAGVTASATAGIMIPISKIITVSGASTLITIPIAFVFGGLVNKIVAPCFSRGKYKKILNKAKYYENLNNVYHDMLNNIEQAYQQYYEFVLNIQKQNEVHQELKKQNAKINNKLQDLYKSI